MDDICQLTLPSTVNCLSSNYNLVSFLSRYAVNFGRMFSPMLGSVAIDISKLLLIMHLTVL